MKWREGTGAWRGSSLAWAGWATVVWGLAFAAPACSSSKSGGATTTGCSLNSDCTQGLICALGDCRSQCSSSVDCGNGGSCIDDGRYPVCQPPGEKNTPCDKLADCPTPLGCASDYRCRNFCSSDSDCNVLGITGRVCAKDMSGVEYCADPGEVNAGVIVVDAPDGAPSTPVVESDAASTAPPSQGPIIATSIGQMGGTVGSGGVLVTIPAGALTSPISVTITPSAQSPAGAVGTAYEVGPTGTTFAQPVTVAFTYSDDDLGTSAPGDYAVETIGADGKTWVALSQIVVDVYAHTIAGQTSHLSPYALVYQPGGAQAATDASAGGAYGDASKADGQ